MTRGEFSAGAHSDIGDRLANEDSFQNLTWGHAAGGGGRPGGWLISVADGLGGHPRGDEAAAAASAAVEQLELPVAGSLTGVELTSVFREAFDRIESLRSHPRWVRRGDPQFQEYQPASTLTVATRGADGVLRVANLGDSRAFVISPDGQLLYVSTAHNSSGYLQKCLGDYPFFDPEVDIVEGLPDRGEGLIVMCATDGAWVPLTYGRQTFHGTVLAAGAYRRRFSPIARHVAEACERVSGDAQALAERLVADSLALTEANCDNSTVSIVVD